MNDNEAEPSNTAAAADLDYEAPAVFDLGKVFDVTYGSTSGAGDESGQRN